MIPTASNIAAARRSWARVLAITDPDGQRTMRAIWATCWARVLLAEAVEERGRSKGDAMVQWYRRLADDC